MKKREAKIIFDKLELDTRQTHHLIGWFIYKGRKILKTRISFGKGEIPGNVEDKIRGQLKLKKKEFRELIDCSLNKEDYIEILKNKGLLQ